MFAPYCATQGSHVLLGYESVVHVEQTAFGPKVLLRCHCGALLTHDAAPGRRARHAETPSHMVDGAGRAAC